MANELAQQEVNVGVVFTPSKIEVKDKELIEKAVKEYAKKYEDLIVTEENLADVKKVKADLNKSVKQLTDRFVSIKKEYTAPLTEFDAWIKSLKSEIKQVVDPIDEAVKEMEEREKQERINKIKKLIAEMAEPYGVEVDEIEIKNEWANKGSFTKKGEVSSKVTKEIANEMTLVKQAKDRLQGDIDIITNYSKTFGFDPESWTSLIKFGQTAPEVMKLIDEAVAEKNARLEQEEEARKAKEEYEQAMQALKKEQQTQVDDKVIDKETGEIIQQQPKLQTVVLRLTGTNEQFHAFNNFLIDNNIKVEKVD